MSKLHDQLIVIDGLNVSNFSRSVFEDMRRGGVTAANCTSSVWENFSETMRNFARWKTWLRDNADLITQVYTTDDIERAKRENRTGIILGWQNSSGIEDRLDTLALFHELGLRIVQLTYNTQNLVGSGCYESARQRALRLRPRRAGRDEPAGHPVRSLPRRRQDQRGRDSRPPSSGSPIRTACRRASRRIRATRATSSCASSPTATASSASPCSRRS